MRWVGRGVLLLTILLVGAAPVAAASKNVTMSETAYEPATVTINVNDDVFWCNPSNQEHTVSADDGSFTRTFPAHSQCNGRTFQVAGTFRYSCKIVTSMHGTVIVGGGAAPPPPPPPPPPSATATTMRRLTSTSGVSPRATTTLARGVTTMRSPVTATTELLSTTIEATTSTASVEMAINETNRDGGTSAGTVAALVATGLMTLAGAAYFVYRVRRA